MIDWTFKHILTQNSGEISSITDVTAVLNDWEVTRKLGDELWIESGEISLETLDALPIGSGHNWLGAYINDVLYDVFEIPQTYDEADQKRDRYTTALDSMQKVFFDDCKDTVVGQGIDTSSSWSYRLIDTYHKITQMRTDAGLIGNRYGFSLGDILDNMAASDATSSQLLGYVVKSMTGPWPVMNDPYLPVIFRGISKDLTYTYYIDAVEWTFTDYGVTFLDLFKIVSFAHNALICAKPSIWTYGGTDYLAVDITVQPRIYITPSGTSSPTWIERSFVRNKYKIDGVYLYSTINNDDGDPSFEYEQGDVDGDHVLEKGVDVRSPAFVIPSDNEDLLLALGAYDGGAGGYDITITGINLSFFNEYGLETYYADMITDGHGYEGEILYDDEDVLDHLNADAGHVMQVNKITIPRRGPAEIEGVQIS